MRQVSSTYLFFDNVVYLECLYHTTLLCTPIGQWCEACYKEKELELPQMTHRPETELWVECESCHRWVHQICSLFNSRRNVGDSVSFVCPTCLCAKRKSNPNMQLIRPTTKKMRASELPVTALSEFLEKRILKRLDIAYRQTATRLGVDPDKVEKCPPLVLRQVMIPIMKANSLNMNASEMRANDYDS